MKIVKLRILFLQLQYLYVEIRETTNWSDFIGFQEVHCNQGYKDKKKSFTHKLLLKIVGLNQHLFPREAYYSPRNFLDHFQKDF